MNERMKNTRFGYVDTLRGIAILGVIAVHVGQYGNFSMPIFFVKMIAEGARGVQLFYLASAFTLFLSLKNRSSNEMNPIKNFFIRRFFRIAPMYYVAIFVYLFLDGLGPRYWLGDATGVSIANIISNITFLHGLNPYWMNSIVPGGWSVGIEMMFYAVLPVLFLKIKTINHAFNFFIISIIVRPFFYIFLSKFNPTGSETLWNN
jgi:peptidoglycan/LPS O-acetylase OafA/YrhL